jgi:hypothetical protein
VSGSQNAPRVYTLPSDSSVDHQPGLPKDWEVLGNGWPTRSEVSGERAGIWPVEHADDLESREGSGRRWRENTSLLVGS